MQTPATIHPSKELPFRARSGWPFLIGIPTYLSALTVLVVLKAPVLPWPVWVAIALTSIVALVSLAGLFVVNPNTSKVLVFFGSYRGTVREAGFYWTNPFTHRRTVSLRAHNLASQKIKVNDLLGNPIEIGAVVVWQVRDTAQASFDVEDYQHYVDVQIETAIRELAKSHPYDEGQADVDIPSLRGDAAVVVPQLTMELQARLDRAGIQVLEARLSHLAYAPEIASAMLQRQQAVAIVAARAKIVEGAVGMVEQALAELSSKHILELDDERRATLVGNLLVVLCGQASPQPILNTGSLYT
jgi:regulator of protease activity HflC (stomatin/prohibitin superfamily)